MFSFSVFPVSESFFQIKAAKLSLLCYSLLSYWVLGFGDNYGLSGNKSVCHADDRKHLCLNSVVEDSRLTSNPETPRSSG